MQLPPGSGSFGLFCPFGSPWPYSFRAWLFRVPGIFYPVAGGITHTDCRARARANVSQGKLDEKLHTFALLLKRLCNLPEWEALPRRINLAIASSQMPLHICSKLDFRLEETGGMKRNTLKLDIRMKRVHDIKDATRLAAEEERSPTDNLVKGAGVTSGRP